MLIFCLLTCVAFVVRTLGRLLLISVGAWVQARAMTSSLLSPAGCEKPGDSNRTFEGRTAPVDFTLAIAVFCLAASPQIVSRLFWQLGVYVDRNVGIHVSIACFARGASHVLLS